MNTIHSIEAEYGDQLEGPPSHDPWPDCTDEEMKAAIEELGVGQDMEAIRRAAMIEIIFAECESCAQVADEWARTLTEGGKSEAEIAVAMGIAKAIRERGEIK